MTLKQKLGEILQTGLGVAGLFIPALKIVQPLVGALAGQVPGQSTSSSVDGLTFDQQILGIIAQVQAMGNVTGLTNDQKRAQAAVLVEQVVLTSRAFMGHPINDSAKFKATINALSGNFADLVDCFKDDHVKLLNAQ